MSAPQTRVVEASGDFVAGSFLRPEGQALESLNPATGAAVLKTAWSPARAKVAVDAASEALPAWRALTLEARLHHLVRFRDAIRAHTEDLADAISLEMGKLRSEARTEVSALVARFDLMADRIRSDMRDGVLAGHPMEALRHRPHGVVAVIGPFNFPLHLCHAHVVPALMLGNTVVMKPSELTPLAGQRYAECAREAGLPAGVFNLVQGGGAMGSALLAEKAVRALCFTGSWPTGRRILEALLDRPEVLVALEMGGKNTSVVLGDADLRQAAHEIIVGKYLTTGQRCTCTDRVLVHKSKHAALLAALVPMVRALRFGDQDDAAAFAGPLASLRAKEGFERALEVAREGGAVELARGTAPGGHAFAAPTLFDLPEGLHHIDGYTDHELFGPNLHVETFGDDDEAVSLVNGSMVPLAMSVFTADESRFARFASETYAGIVNLNRSTNQASPRLPFGGTGTAGNYRPAGSHAPRNLAVPVAVQRKVSGALVADPKLRATLPAPDLAALEAKHGIEECKEAARSLLEARRPLSPRLPKGGALPQSAAWLERLYGESRVPAEKKPGVFDHLRSSGPWMVSVDDEPLTVLDGMSQTATIPAGFAEDEVVRAYMDGAFGDTLLASDDTAVREHPAATAYADFLRAQLPGLPHVSFVGSGAEANEKAYALCLKNRRSDKQRKLLAFDGSFHGRTLLSLQASHSPAKRAPFEIKGYEVEYAPYAAWWAPHDAEPEVPEWFAQAMADGRVEDALAHGAKSHDRLLKEEVNSLAEVHRQLSSGEFFAVVIEPMQSEGGDRYATARFHRGLRLLTRHHGVPLILDEVQSGFGLGGTFAWHQRFGLQTKDGSPDVPDAVLFAKRAQVGVVMSAFEDPEPTSAHTASLVRGLIHAEIAAHDLDVERIERSTRARLDDIAKRYPSLVSHPRATGYALAFDLPSAEHLTRFLAQRFWRGVVVFAAGSRTVRYRLSRAFGEQEIETLFLAMDRSLAWLHANPGLNPPDWLDVAAHSVDLEDADEQVRIRAVGPDEVDAVLREVLALEARVYEPARQDTPETLGLAFRDPDGVRIIAEANVDGVWKLVGSALAAPLELVADVDGPDRDTNLGQHNTVYSVAITMDPDHRGAGLGRSLKLEQLRAARDMKRSDGTPRYRYLTGRNRVGLAAAMTRINRSFGAYEVDRLFGQYGEPDGETIYYRIPLGAWAPRSRTPLAEPDSHPSGAIDVASTLARPFAAPAASLMASMTSGLLFGPAVNKLTLVNYVTPAVVRGVEYVANVAHRFPHMYLTSSRDEAFDKTVRSLRVHRKHAQVVIGLEGGYVGHTSAAARSLTDPAVHGQGPGYFDHWLRVPHPEVVGAKGFGQALRAAIDKAGGADAVLGIFVETLQERTGRVLDDAAAQELAAVRRETGVPFAFAETAGAYFRTGNGAFSADGLASGANGVDPDAMFWWAGGQLGFVHVQPQYFVATPLTLVSTWDGDELSLIRAQHQLRAARNVDMAQATQRLGDAIAPAAERGVTIRGLGLYRVIDGGAKAQAWVDGLRREGVRTRAFANGALVLAPALDTGAAEYARIKDALRKVLQ
jgi:RHH-type proline utilization regulon transcriptional repressor/proline dehydrogenase/delta 1-pyrroline-5-carboxylate dehydrogenase